MMSTCAAIFATTAGWRYVLPSTMVPTRRRGTRAASALRVLHDSSMAPSRSFVFGKKWSVTQAMSHPVASRCRQRSSTPDQVWPPMLVNRPKRISFSYSGSISRWTAILSQLGSSFPRLWHIVPSEPRENRDAFRDHPSLRGAKWACAGGRESCGRRPADRSGRLRKHLGIRCHRPRLPSGGPAHRAVRRGYRDPPRRAGDGSPAGPVAKSGGACPARADHASGVQRAAAARRGSRIDHRGFRGARPRLRLALPSARRVAFDHAAALGGRASGPSLAGARLARGPRRPTRADRLVGGLAVDRAGGPRVRRLGGGRRPGQLATAAGGDRAGPDRKSVV